MCSNEIIPIINCREGLNYEYNLFNDLNKQLISELIKKREQQIKDAILARGYIVDDWSEFAKNRCTVVVGSNSSIKSLFVDHVLICRWSDDVVAEYDFSNTDLTTTLTLKMK